MTDNIGLAFLPNPGGEAEGLSDAGVETFRDKPFAAVARETGQNSRDARDDANQPVRMTFDVVTVPSIDFPEILSYRAAARLCLDKAKSLNKEKDTGFFEQALHVLDQPGIRVLRISDFNTKGVPGPCEEGKPFHTLAKADGITDKDEVDSGGSFGIGKNAVFALSDIQTAYFSTIYRDEFGTNRALCIGKTLFISHKGVDGVERRRKGYWGKVVGFMPIDDPALIPDWLRRTSRGTSIFSICMRQNPTDWRYEMAAALLINFFAAIERKEMEFEIDHGFLKINRNTIESLFSDGAIINAVEQLKLRAAFDAAKTLHTVLVDGTAISLTLSVPDLGDVHMRMLLRESLGYTIGIIRNGMYITDNLANFNEPFKRFPLHKEFAVVIEPAGKREGEWFKRLEGPKHNDLSAERITDPAKRRTGEKLFSSLAKQVREKIRAIAKSAPTTTLELDELNDLFASERTRIEDDQGLEEDPRSFEPTPIHRAPPKPATKKARPGGGTLLPGPRPQPVPVSDPPNPGAVGSGPVPRPRALLESVILEKERAILPDAGNRKRRRILFNAPVDGKIWVTVDATGLSEPEPLRIISTTLGEVRDGSVELTCSQGARITFDVEFDIEYAGAVELTAVHLNAGAEAAE